MTAATLFHILARAARAGGSVARLGALNLLRISRLALKTAEDVVREEMQAGRVGPLAAKVAGHARHALTDKLTKRLLAVLLLRLGIESALASTVVGLLLPFVLEYAIHRLGRTSAWERLTAREDVGRVREQVRAHLRTGWQKLRPAPVAVAPAEPPVAPI